MNCVVCPALQDLLSLVRYRILGQRGPSNARQVRTATAVLASRHVVQDPHTPSAAGGGGGSGEEDGPGATLSGPATTPGSPTQLQEQQALPTPAGVSGEAAMQQQHQQQQRLGACMPALAVSLQEPRQVEEVMLFFGVIDFLQVGAAPVGEVGGKNTSRPVVCGKKAPCIPSDWARWVPRSAKAAGCCCPLGPWTSWRCSLPARCCVCHLRLLLLPRRCLRYRACCCWCMGEGHAMRPPAALLPRSKL